MKERGEKWRAKGTNVLNGIGVKADTIVTVEHLFKSGNVTYEVGETGIVLAISERDFEKWFEKVEE